MLKDKPDGFTATFIRKPCVVANWATGSRARLVDDSCVTKRSFICEKSST